MAHFWCRLHVFVCCVAELSNQLSTNTHTFSRPKKICSFTLRCSSINVKTKTTLSKCFFFYFKTSPAFKFFCFKNLSNRDTNVPKWTMIFFYNRYNLIFYTFVYLTFWKRLATKLPISISTTQRFLKTSFSKTSLPIITLLAS